MFVHSQIGGGMIIYTYQQKQYIASQWQKGVPHETQGFLKNYRMVKEVIQTLAIEERSMEL